MCHNEYVSLPTCARTNGARRRPDRLLASALARWVELPVDRGKTHVSASGGTFSSIDRVWTLLPRSLLALVRPRAGFVA